DAMPPAGPAPEVRQQPLPDVRPPAPTALPPALQEIADRAQKATPEEDPKQIEADVAKLDQMLQHFQPTAEGGISHLSDDDLETMAGAAELLKTAGSYERALNAAAACLMGRA